MIAALIARPKSIQFRGETIVLRRPQVVDLVGLIDARERGLNLVAWLIWTHVMDGDEPAYRSYEECLELDAVAAGALAAHIDAMYSEGMD